MLLIKEKIGGDGDVDMSDDSSMLDNESGDSLADLVSGGSGESSGAESGGADEEGDLPDDPPLPPPVAPPPAPPAPPLPPRAWHHRATGICWPKLQICFKFGRRIRLQVF